MKDCIAPVKITARAAVIDVTPETISRAGSHGAWRNRGGASRRTLFRAFAAIGLLTAAHAVPARARPSRIGWPTDQ